MSETPASALPPSRLARVVKTALAQTRRNGVTEICREIAQAFDSFACILWEVTPFSDLSAEPPQGSLFVVAAWVEGEKPFALHDLLLQSATGRAVLENRLQHVENVNTDGRVVQGVGRFFVEANKIEVLCALPVMFESHSPSTKGTGRGALTLYRREPSPLTEQELAELEEVAALLPGLYRALFERMSIQFLGEVRTRLRKAMEAEPAEGVDLVAARTELGEVTGLVAEWLGCRDCALFLRSASGGGAFEVAGSTWPKAPETRAVRSSRREGLTPWVLHNGKPLLLFDLASFDRDQETVCNQYPGLNWKGQEELLALVAGILAVGPEGQLPPLSFLAVPVRAGGEVVGCLRCSLPTGAPFFFSSRELNLLEVVAERLGDAWKDLLARVAVERENRSWKALVESVSRLNSFVHEELKRDEPSDERIFREALQVAHSAIAGSDVLDIRLLNEAKSELAFFEFAGPGFQRVTPERVAELKQMRFPVRGPDARSAGAEVVRTGKPYWMEDVRKDPHYTPIFDHPRQMIIAPIQLEGEVYGVLDVRRSGPEPFPDQALRMAQLLGNQLGLYQFLAGSIRELKGAKAELRQKVQELQERQESEAKMYQDLAHQLKSPLLLAHRRAQEAASLSRGTRVELELEAIRGLCGKAKRVATNVRLFSELAHGERPRVRLTDLNRFDLINLVTTAAGEHSVLLDPGREVRFQVDRDSFLLLRRNTLPVDRDLLEQAVSTLLDNAAKYSFAKTVVRVHGGATRGRRFHISVANTGIPLRPSEAPLATQRGWRSEKAMMVTGEGSGIGLWIVKAIMEAHGGELEVVPTTANNITEIRLIFPTPFDLGGLL